MWPWGHVAVGYLAYSLARRLLGRDPPSELATLVLVPASLLPDLVDKPLSWWLGLFPSGYAVGHSVLVAGPVGVAVILASARRGWGTLGVAFCVGYWSHLAGDVFSGVLLGEGPAYSAVLWPLVERAPYGEDLGLFGRSWHYLRAFADAATATDRPLAMLAAYLAPLALAFVCWLADGRPGVGAIKQSSAWLSRR
jgi:hypothetical protein